MGILDGFIQKQFGLSDDTMANIGDALAGLRAAYTPGAPDASQVVAQRRQYRDQKAANQQQIAYQKMQMQHLQGQLDSAARDKQMDDELSAAFKPTRPDLTGFDFSGTDLGDIPQAPAQPMDIKDIAAKALPIYAKYGKTKDALNLSKMAQFGDPDQTEYGLVPQKGINPETGKQEMFIQDKLGRTKWLGIQPPPDMQFVAPTDYRAGFMVDKRNPTAPAVNVGGLPNGPIGYQQNAPTQQQVSTPVDQNAPWKGIVAPAEQDRMKDRVYQTARKELDTSADWLNTERQKLELMNRFGQLNRQQSTGGIAQGDWLPNFIAPNDVVEMRGLASKMTPTERPAGSGATSDFEQRLYREAIPSPDKPGPVNANIRAFRQAMVDDAQQLQDFKEQYLNQYGHLNGVNKAWSDYKKANPLLSNYQSVDNFQINPKRQSLADWMASGGAQQRQQQSIQAPSSAVDYLRRNYKLDRSLISAFDAKYGPGSAAAILKGQ